jgi:UDP-hydrolysing UDP-N-acetyl-D-glucosamine 2-epimerase
LNKYIIGYLTTSRSDFYPALPLLERLKNHRSIKLDLIVAGGHVLDSQGYTLDAIREKGFEPATVIPFLDDREDNPLSSSIQILDEGISGYLINNKPDLIIVPGDRFEILSVAYLSVLEGIQLAHISGGDITLGVIDNRIRNAVSMLSSWHFPGTPDAQERLKSMGVRPDRICMCGELGIEAITKVHETGREPLFRKLGLSGDKPVAVCTFHPETVGNRINAVFVEEVITGIISRFNYHVLATASNFDRGGREINTMIEKLSRENNSLSFHANLGSELYYSLLKEARLIFGNSSSAIIESQTFDVPAVNIGTRQEGRITNPNTLTCEAKVSEVLETCREAVSDVFRESFTGKVNYYGDGNSSSKIISFIEKRILNAKNSG